MATKVINLTNVPEELQGGALFLHPDGGVAYSTTIFGLVSMRDGVFEPLRERQAP